MDADHVLEPGDVVTYVDEVGVSHEALVTICHGNTLTSAINVAYVSSDETKKDSYGRQVERASSVSIKTENHTAEGGRYYIR